MMQERMARKGQSGVRSKCEIFSYKNDCKKYNQTYFGNSRKA